MNIENNFYLVIGGAFPQECDFFVNKKYRKGYFPAAGIFYERKILESLKINKFNTIFLSAPVVGDFPKNAKKIFFHKRDFDHFNFDKSYSFVSYCLFYPILHLSKTMQLIFGAKKIFKNKNLKNSKLNIVITESHLPYLKTAMFIRKKIIKTANIILIMQDMPHLTLKNSNSKIYKIFKKKNVNKIYKIIKQSDFLFILLSERMNDFLNLPLNRYKVIPGIQDAKPIYYKKGSTKDFVTFSYMGKLSEENGVIILIDAFLSMNLKNTKLIICGNGPLSSYVKKISEKNPNILFFGYVEQSELKPIYDETDVFVAPRLSKAIFSSFSFPSKVLDYLSTRKPVISFKLDTYGAILDNILYYPENEDSVSLACIMRKFVNNTIVLKDNSEYQKSLDIFLQSISTENFAKNLDELVKMNENFSN